MGFSGDDGLSTGTLPALQGLQRSNRLIQMTTLSLQFRYEFPNFQTRPLFRPKC